MEYIRHLNVISDDYNVNKESDKVNTVAQNIYGINVSLSGNKLLQFSRSHMQLMLGFVYSEEYFFPGKFLL